LISVLVTVFSSIANVFVDYLFISILSAPTAAETTSIETTTKDTLRVSSHVSPSSLFSPLPSTKDIPSSPSTGAAAVSRMSSSLQEQVRVVPHELIEAHSAAVNSFKQLVGEDRVKAEIKLREFHKANRSTRLKLPSGQAPQPLSLSALSSTVPVIDTTSSEEILSSLLQDLLEERKKIRKPVEKESFDALWG
jgi:hypothetical protein